MRWFNIKCSMKYLISSIVMVLLICPSAQGGVIQLDFTTMSPANNWCDRAEKAWVKWIEHKSNGRLKIKFHYGSLNPPGQEYAAVQGGLADMGSVYSSFLAGRVDANEVLCLPWMIDWPGGVQASLAHMELYQKFPALQKEFKGVKLLCFSYANPTQIQTIKKPIRTVADLKGIIQIEIGTYATDAMKLMGTTPVFFPPMENFDAMSKGVANGISVNWDACISFGYIDLINYSTEVSLTEPGFFAYIVNLRSWERLPDDLKEIFEWDNSIEMAKLFGYGYDMNDKDAREVMNQRLIKRGSQGIYVLPKEEKTKWRTMTKSIEDNWVKKVGGDAAHILAEAKKVVMKYKWNDQLEKECDQLLQRWETTAK